MAPAAATGALAAWVKAHPAGFRTAYPSRRVNSLYLDSHTHWALEGNLSGQAHRFKVRYRWYGPLADPAQGVLEVKRKAGRVGWKQLYPLAAPLPLAGRTWPGVLSELEQAVDAAGRMLVHTVPCPTLINKYDRAYYESLDGAVRLTVDERLSVFDQRRAPTPNLRLTAPLPAITVVELKCAWHHHRRLEGMLQTFPVRAARMSKYVTGLTAAAF